MPQAPGEQPASLHKETKVTKDIGHKERKKRKKEWDFGFWIVRNRNSKVQANR